MKTKTLVLKFSYDRLVKEWVKEKGYRIPTLEEAELLDYDHEEILILSDESHEHDRALYKIGRAHV